MNNEIIDYLLGIIKDRRSIPALLRMDPILFGFGATLKGNIMYLKERKI